MQISRKQDLLNNFLKKQALAATALIVMLSISMFAAVTLVSAHEPPWEIPTYSYISVDPNPVGVNQTVFIVFWVNRPPPTSTGIAGDRWRNLTVEITKPDGTKETLGPFTSDPIGGSYSLYRPDQIGQYTFFFSWPGQKLSLTGPSGIPGTDSPFVNDTFLGSNATTTLTVQQEQIQVIPENPLPTSYWTRPIEGQNPGWASLASHWLGGSHLRGWNSLWQKDGTAPNSPHIMWTRPIEFGGIVGGTTEIPGTGFYSGGSYEGRFDDAIIMNGRLYFTLPLGHAPKGGGYISIDLRTGEEIWYRNDLGVNDTAGPSMGQLYQYESFNQHGVVGGILWQVEGRTWNAYDPFTGLWMYTLTNVPSGFEVYTDRGEIVRYVLNYPGRWLALWNNTAEQQGLHGGIGNDTNAYQWRPNGKVVDMSNAYSWNVTIPDLPGTQSPTIVKVIPGDIILGRSSNVGLTNTPRGTDDPYTLWALSDKPESRGQLLWIKSYPAPPGNITRMLAAQPVDVVNRVFTMTDYETGQRLGYSLDTGELLWGPSGITYQEPGARAYQYYSGREGFPAYGNLYLGGFGGEVFAYSLKDGSLLWKFNDTFSGLEGPWGNHPNAIFAIADNKVFAFTNEHSPTYPLYKEQKIYALDAFTGEEIWSLMGIAGTTGGARQPTSVVADGFVVFYNFYDNQIYCIGKGPSKTTITAPSTSIPEGNSILITGTVTDDSPGAKAKVASGEFTIVPAISDADQGRWMEHIYMQKPKPEDATGVVVKLTAVGPDGTTIDIGSTTSNTNGNFALTWSPPSEGLYWIKASFEGSESYWPSQAETAINVVTAAPQPTTSPTTSPSQTTSPTESPTTSPTTTSPTPAPEPGSDMTLATYAAIAAAAIIAAVIAAAIILKRRTK